MGAHRRLRATMAHAHGQHILNDARAGEPAHRLDPLVPIVARIVWEQDGEKLDVP